jgi:hypothetical protein
LLNSYEIDEIAIAFATTIYQTFIYSIEGSRPTSSSRGLRTLSGLTLARALSFSADTA